MRPSRRERAAGARPRWLVGVTEYAGVTGYTGGIGRHYASLLPALVRAGVDVDLALFDGGRLIRPDAPGGVTLVAHRRFARVPAVFLPVVRAAAFRRLASRGRYDRILLPEWGGIGALLASRENLVTNLATSMRLSNDVSGVRVADLPLSRRALVAVQNTCEDRQIRRSRGVMPISRAMEARNRDLLGRLPTATVVRNCIDVAEVQARAAGSAPPRDWPVGPGPIVLFLGRLERRKGVVDAADAFATVAARHPDARFVFAGSPGDSRFEPTRQELLRRTGSLPEGRVTLLGHVPGDELYAGIARASVVVCPSRWEGFGQVALEVKAIGRPLVVTSGSGYDDFCRDGVDARIVRPGAPAELAEAVANLLDDRGTAEHLGETARRGIDRFTANAVAPDVVAAVTALGEPPRGSTSRRRA
ncbi:Alpha-D-kanosaminyltransferase [Frondihabitans sp. 762G35]|nr:Alpha-D-kanosaminyltransferase [Frondihabitans sp. 762G35]